MSRETWKKLNQLHTEKEKFMSQKVSIKTPKTGTQMPLINVDAAQEPTVKVKPAKAPKASKAVARETSAKTAASPAATKGPKPKTAKVEQKTEAKQVSAVERPLFKTGMRLFYLRERGQEITEKMPDGSEKKVRRKGRPFGCVAYEFSKVNETYSFRCGLSLVNKKFDNWDRVKAREIAVGRCSQNPVIMFDFTSAEAKHELEFLKEDFTSSSNYEVLFTLQELRRFHPMTRVTKAIDAKLAEYALRKNDGA